MKKVVFTFVLFFAFLATSNAQEGTVTLTIEVDGMTTDTGKVFIAMYDSEETFLKSGKRTLGTKATVKDGKATASFKNIKKGTYAISLFHDENDNNKMDTKIFGIPKEPYGFSNNAKGFMGPPSFDDTKFTLDTDKTISITIK